MFVPELEQEIYLPLKTPALQPLGIDKVVEWRPRKRVFKNVRQENGLYVYEEFEDI